MNINFNYRIKILSATICLIWLSLCSFAQPYIAASTYFNGSAADEPKAVVHVGTTAHIIFQTSSANFPVTNGSSNTAGVQALVYTRLNTVDGSILTSVYLGPGELNFAANLQVVGNDVYVAARTNLATFPVTTGPAHSGGNDVLFIKLNALTGNIQLARYMGGANGDEPKFLHIDGNNAIICGTSNSANFPVTNGSTHGGVQDVFWAKMDINTGAILFATYLGGVGGDDVTGTAVAGGRLYMYGVTSSANFAPITTGGALAGGSDFFYYAANISNGSVVVSRLIGGNFNETSVIRKLIVSNNEVHFAGNTNSTNYPTTNGSSLNGSGISGDICYTKLNATTGAIIRSYITGGSGADSGGDWDIAGGSIHIALSSTSQNFPVTNGSQFSGTSDIVYAKLDLNTGLVQAATFFPGSGIDTDPTLKIQGNDAYITINTSTPNFATTDGGTSQSGGTDNYIIKFNTNSLAICFGTYLGGASSDFRRLFDVIGTDLFLYGNTQSNNFPVTTNRRYSFNTDGYFTRIGLCPAFPAVTDNISPATQTKCNNGFADVLTGNPITMPAGTLPVIYRNGIAQTENDLTASNYQWQEATAPGGPWTDIAGAINANYLPSISGINKYYRRTTRQSACCGGAIISTSSTAAVLVSGTAAPTVNAGGLINTCPGTAVTIGGSPTATGGASPYTYSWDNGAGTTANPSVSPALSTVYTVIVTDAAGCSALGQAVVNSYSANAGPDVSRCQGTPVRIGTDPVQGLPGVTYSWAPTTGLDNPNVAQPFANPASSTTYTLTLTIPRSGGGTCVTNDAVLVTTISAPTTANFAGPDRVLCPGSTTTLGAAAEGGFTYAWTPGIYLNNPTISNPTYTAPLDVLPPANPMRYVVTASRSGCSFTDETQVSVVKANAGADRCSPGIVGLGDLMPGLNETYSWSVVSGPGVIIGPANQPTAIASFAGGTTVYRLTVTLGSVSCTDDVTISSCGNCTATIEVLSQYGCAQYSLNGSNVSLRASAGLNPDDYIYTWSPAAGLSSSTGRTVQLTDNVSRTYTVTAVNIYDPSNTCTANIQTNIPGAVVPVFTAQDRNACSGQVVNIGQANNPAYTYAWTGTGLSSNTVSNPSLTVTQQADYPVQVTHTLSGCFIRDTATVAILSSPANAGPDYTVCNNAIITLGTPAQPNTTYSWAPAVAPWQNGTNATFARPDVLVAANITYTLTATNSVTGCITNDAMTITVNNSPTIPNAPDVSVCRGQGVQIGSPALPGVTYSWAPATGLSCTTCAQPTASPTSTTFYTCTATFSGSCLATATDNVTVTVNGPSFTMAPINYCPSSSGAIALGAGSPAGMSSYTWSPGSLVSNATIQNPNTLNPPPSVPTTFTLTVRDAGGCVASADQVLTPNTPTPISGVNRTLCVGNSVTIGSPLNPTGGGITYTWTSAPAGATAGLSSTTNPNPTFTPTLAMAGLNTFTLTKVQGGCTSTATVTVMVNSFQLPVLVSPTVCGNSDVQIGTAPQIGAQYNWTPATNLSNSQIANPVASVGSSTVIYTLNAIGPNGCPASSAVAVGANPALAPDVTINPVTGCLGGIANTPINTTVSPAGTYNYTWSPNDGTLTNIYVEDPLVFTGGVGNRTYRLVVSQPSTGCVTAANTTVTLSNCAVLAAGELRLTARKENENALLTWTTKNEVNTSHFTVEMSTDGITYHTVGTISARNIAEGQQQYYFRHVLTGINNTGDKVYYRIRLHNRESKYMVSNVAVVKTENRFAVQIWPNPLEGMQLNIKVQLANPAQLTIGVYDINGRLMFHNQQQARKGLNIFAVNSMQQLPAGVYMVRVADEANRAVHTGKIIKTK